MNSLLPNIRNSFQQLRTGWVTLRFNRIALGIGAIALISYWSYSTNAPAPTTPVQPSAGKNAPDFFIHNANVVEYDKTGFLKGNLTAKEISHYPHNSITTLTYPDMWSYKKDKSPWQTTADRGRILPDGETLELSKNVVIVQVDDANKPTQRVDTEFLTVYSALDYAETEEPVRLTNPMNVVNAVGMRAYYQRDFIQLKSRVKGIHETRQKL